MFKLLVISLAFISMAQAKPILLKCELEYDPHFGEDEETLEFEMKGVEKEDGTILFSSSETNLHTYFFPSYGPAIWHSQAKFEFDAKLDGDKLTYQYKFFNNLRDKNTVAKVFDETREVTIDFYEVEYDDDFSFDAKDGSLLKSEINKDDWINEKGYDFEECTISYEIEKIEEVDVETNRRSFFSRIFNL